MPSTRVRRRAAAAGAALILLIVIAIVGIELRSRRRFDTPYPALRASADAAVVERGHYLAYGPATCAYCHVPRSDWPRLSAGATLPLSGAHLFLLPFGRFYSSNLTPDLETGIGRRSDGELARVLRHGVRADGRAAFPFMEYQHLSDEDVVAILSFLRSQPPVRNLVPEHGLNLTGKALMAFVIGPVGPTRRVRATSPAAEPTVERGEYLANDVALCVACHTDRSSRDHSFVGPMFAGGQRMDFAADATRVFVTPNLTPEPETGRIARWTEEQFLTRFRAGETIPGSIMPWGAYARMTEADVRAIYKYLRALPPVRNDTGAVLQPK